MTTLNNNNTLDLSSIGLGSPRRGNTTNVNAETEKNKLQQADFLKLMITQIQHQDPTQPQDPEQFLEQLAQFSMVDGVDKLNKSFDTLSNSLQSQYALQASTLVGHSVEVKSNQGHLANGKDLVGTIEVPYAVSDLSLTVTDEIGTIVKKVSFGEQGVGEHQFNWDGLNAKGERMPAGVYKLKAEAKVDGKTEAFDTKVFGNVDSVTLGQGTDLVLNIAGIGQVPFSEVKRIN